MRRAAAVGAGALIAGALAAGGVRELTSSSASTTPPVTPPIVKVASVGETTVVLDWGPSQPGELRPGAAKPKSLVITWAPSKDTLHPGTLTYTIAKNGKIVKRGLTVAKWTAGFTTSIRTFRVCVTAVNPSTTNTSPPMCATFTGA